MAPLKRNRPKINSQGAYAFRMMRMTVLASGSKGNSTLVSSSRTRILVDAGLSCRELLKRMQMANEDPTAIDALLVTHEHQDHVQGVAVLARKLGVPVYFTQATHRAWMRWMMPHKRITYAAWLAQRQQNLAQKQTAVVSAAEDISCAEDAPEFSQEEPRPRSPGQRRPRRTTRAGCPGWSTLPPAVDS